MKKIVCILFSLTFLVAAIFADKSRFYENGKIIDTMYVNSEDGLKVRDYPSLKSNRLCGLPHGILLKVVAIGREETIDDITAPWVEILLPRYEWKDDNPEYGWVFGGYLSGQRPENTQIIRNANELKQFILANQIWYSGALYYYFKSDGTYISWVESTGKENRGTWKVLDNRTMKLSINPADLASYAWDSETFRFEKIEKGFFKACKTINYTIPIDSNTVVSSTNIYYPSVFFESVDKITSGEKLYYLCSSDGSDFLNLYIIAYENKIDSVDLQRAAVADELMKIGLPPVKNSNMEKFYRAYWNPIMEQHQKKADKMK